MVVCLDRRRQVEVVGGEEGGVGGGRVRGGGGWGWCEG